MKMLKVFFAHPKNVEAKRLEYLAGSFRGQFHRDDRSFSITYARDEFNANFTKAGSWDRWIAQVLKEVPFGSTQAVRKYDVVAVTSIDVGRATFEIVSNALDSRIQTVVWVGAERKFVAVRGIEQNGASADWNDFGRLLI